MQITGRRTRAIFDGYSIIGGQEMQDAAAKLEKRLKRSLGTIPGIAGEGKEDEDGKDDDGGTPLKEWGLREEELVAEDGFEASAFGL